MFRKPISCALSPNTERDDVWLALRTILTPWKWKLGRETAVVERWFRDYFHTETAVSFNSGRSALFALLHAFGIGRGDEVLVQAFTCVAVPDAVIWTGAKPVFVDIDDSLTIDPFAIENHITPRTKGIVVQHTFGVTSDMKRILAIAKKYKLVVIEDFAHAMSIPMTGDAAFFSFGRDKVLSSVWGGMAITNTKIKIKEFQKNLPLPGAFWIFQQLLHPIAFSIILRLYDVIIGKVLLVLLQKIKLLSLPVYSVEKTGGQPKDFPAKYPNGLAILLLNQLKKLGRFEKNREETVKFYGGKGPLLRYPVLVKDPRETIRRAKKQGILLGNWYHNVIDPAGVDMSSVGYTPGSCPKAEEAAKHIVNLPTLISTIDAKRVLTAL